METILFDLAPSSSHASNASLGRSGTVTIETPAESPAMVPEFIDASPRPHLRCPRGLAIAQRFSRAAGPAEVLEASMAQLRKSLALLLMGAQCDVSTGADVTTSLWLDLHPAAAVREPTFLDELRWMCASMEIRLALAGRCEDMNAAIAMAWPNPHPADSLHRSTAAQAIVKLLMERSLELQVPAGGPTEPAELHQHPAASLPEASLPIITDREQGVRGSLDLPVALRASYESVSGVVVEAFFRENPVADSPPSEEEKEEVKEEEKEEEKEGKEEEEVSDTAAPCSGSSSCCSETLNGSADMRDAISMNNCPSSGDCCSSSAPLSEEQKQEAEKAAKPASSGRLSGGLKAKLCKLVRRFLESCVGHSVASSKGR